MTERNTRVLPASMLVLLLLTGVAGAGEHIPAKTDVCVSCHGALGVSNYDLWPNIAGQKRVYLVKQLKAFRDGGRYDPWMTPVAVPLTDAEIEELAEFYSRL